MAIHRRRSIRLREYDYRQTGAYFVTIVAHDRAALFGKIADCEMRLNEFGQIVEKEWQKSSVIRSEIELDVFVIMPNHIHGILNVIVEGVAAPGRSPRSGPAPHSFDAFVAGFKSAVTTRINELRHTRGTQVWQRNYYEHVIRNDDELLRVREYIVNNPLDWDNDRENPSRTVDLKSVRPRRTLARIRRVSDDRNWLFSGRPAGRPYRNHHTLRMNSDI
jgi:putative transposase